MSEDESKSRGVAPKGFWDQPLFDYRDIDAKATTGSVAGSGSGDFHVYRNQRRRELLRLQDMELRAAERAQKEEEERNEEDRKRKNELRSIKKAEKRNKQKARKKHAAAMRKKHSTSAGDEVDNVFGSTGTGAPAGEVDEHEKTERNKNSPRPSSSDGSQR
mmetsp:Transcript_13643/g.27943  ORF Transcript_13643/g.27943 Transcript_13643/m.27943 type:complete len:161 (+) Transcript_13643:895-1377(+)